MKRIWAVGILLMVGCAPGLPGPGGGARAVAPRSGEVWVPARVDRDLPPSTPPEMPSADVLARRNALTLTDVIDIALHNNPTTRISWSNARAAAARLGAARGDYLPTAQVDLRANKQQTSGVGGTGVVQQQTQSVTGSFTWLLLDLNRGPSISAARNALQAADWTHNAAVQDVVLQVGQAYYTYAAFRALLAAQQATKAEADTNLMAAEGRRRVGLATIAEVLQARTAAAQALLDLQRTEGDVAATRGALAVSTGLPPNADFDVDSLAGTGPSGASVDSVEVPSALARDNRPDLAAAAATWRQTTADARAAYAKRLPSITAQGNMARTFVPTESGPRRSYLVGVGLNIPIFNGFTW